MTEAKDDTAKIWARAFDDFCAIWQRPHDEVEWIEKPPYGVLPLVGTLRRLEVIPGGWKGYDDERGIAFQHLYDPSVPAFAGKTMPMPEDGLFAAAVDKEGYRISGVYKVELPASALKKKRRSRKRSG